MVMMMNESEGETADLEQMNDIDRSDIGQTSDRLPLDDSATGPVDIDTSTVDLHELQIQYDALLKGDVDVENAISTDVFHTIDSRLKDERDTMKDLRTARLWVQYMDKVNIMRTIIESEPTGDWKLHLKVLSDMFPCLDTAAWSHSVHQIDSRISPAPPAVVQMYSILTFNGSSTMVFKLCDVQTVTVLDYQQIVTSGPGDRAGSYEELEDHMRLDKRGGE
jgi:hypothetical protein